MTYLLDTNTCIRYLNGRSESIRQHIQATPPRELVLCSVVKAELIYGALKSARPTQNLERQSRFFDRFVSLPFDDGAARAYGEIRARLERLGTLIGPNDLFIGAIALAHGATLITNNTREFSRVQGLRLEDWD